MFSQMKLGCLPPKHDPRTLKLAKYLAPAQLPTPPASTNWRAKKPGWDMLGNDRAGDCTIACVGHLDEVWAANNGDVQLGYTDQQALAEYAAATGYDPNTGANDNGAAIIDILNRWRQVGIFGNKLGAYASVTMHDHAEVATAIWLFGGVDAGVQLPLAWQGTKLWTMPSHRLRFWQRWQWQPGSWGGHCLAPKTRVLTADLRWEPIENIRCGDELVGFDEFSPPGVRREYRSSRVERTSILELPCYELTFEDGTKVTASEDHLWLVDCGRDSKWLRTDKMRVRGPGGKYGTKVFKPLNVWNECTTRNAGYLAAAFDGEGWLSTGGSHRGIHKLGLAQRDNEMLANVRRALAEMDIPYAENSTTGGFKGSTIQQVRISGRPNILRFLGECRPHRLLPKFTPDRIGSLHSKRSALIEKKFVGIRPVVALGTSTRTFLAEGMASHNCVPVVDFDAQWLYAVSWGQVVQISWDAWDTFFIEAYACLDSLWTDGTKPAPSGFDIAALNADLQAIGAN